MESSATRTALKTISTTKTEGFALQNFTERNRSDVMGGKQQSSYCLSSVQIKDDGIINYPIM